MAKKELGYVITDEKLREISSNLADKFTRRMARAAEMSGLKETKEYAKFLDAFEEIMKEEIEESKLKRMSRDDN